MFIREILIVSLQKGETIEGRKLINKGKLFMEILLKVVRLKLKILQCTIEISVDKQISVGRKIYTSFGSKEF